MRPLRFQTGRLAHDLALAQRRSRGRHVDLRLRRRERLALSRSVAQGPTRRHLSGPVWSERRRPAPPRSVARRAGAGDVLHPRVGGRAVPGQGEEDPRRRLRDRPPRLSPRAGSARRSREGEARLRAWHGGARPRAGPEARRVPRAELGSHAAHALAGEAARDVLLVEPDGQRVPLRAPRHVHRRAARAVDARRRAILHVPSHVPQPAHEQPRGRVWNLARRVPRPVRVGWTLQPDLPPTHDRPSLAAADAAKADPLHQGPRGRLVRHGTRGGAALAQGRSMTTPTPYRIHVPDPVLADVRARLERVRWPDEAPGEAWRYGTDLAYMKELVAYWHDKYDWRINEAGLNRFRQFTAPVGGIDVHLIHEPRVGPNPLPLLLFTRLPGS